jgi:hypothetical protein
MPRKNIEKEKPEDLKPGRLVTTYGTCKYCNQLVTIKADPDATDEEKNKIASSECSCKDAQQAADADTAVRIMTDNINSRYSGTKESVRKMLISALKPVAYGYIDKVTVKVSKNVSIKIYKSTNGLNVAKTIKEEDNIDEHSNG